MKTKKLSHIEMFAKGLKKTNPNSPLIAQVRQKYDDIKNGREVEVEGVIKKSIKAKFNTWEEAKEAGVV